MRRAIGIAVVCSMIIFAAVAASMTPKTDERLKGAFRRPSVNGWTYVHLEGTSEQIGYQHGYLLATEIQDLYKVYALMLPMTTGKIGTFSERRRRIFCGRMWSRSIATRCRGSLME